MTDSAKRVRTRAVCRTCMVSWGVFMEIEDGKVVHLIGDRDDTASHGYTCARGRDIVTHLYGPNRLLRPLRKTRSAEFDYEEPHTGIPRMSSISVHVTIGPQRGPHPG